MNRNETGKFVYPQVTEGKKHNCLRSAAVEDSEEDIAVRGIWEPKQR